MIENHNLLHTYQKNDCYNHYENTMTAFKKALEAGADMIETDVRMTKDGVLVLIHDDSVDRTTDGTGKVKDFTYNQLQELNAGTVTNPEKIPSFDDFMKWASESKMMVNIEFKEYHQEGNEERCVECIKKIIDCVEKYDMAEQVVINSFDAWVLEYVHNNYEKKYMIHGFYPYDIMINVNQNPDEYLDCACIFSAKNKEYYDYLEKKDIEVWIGAGVTQENLLELSISYGAKLITTNNPADVLKKLKGLGKR